MSQLASNLFEQFPRCQFRLTRFDGDRPLEPSRDLDFPYSFPQHSAIDRLINKFRAPQGNQRLRFQVPLNGSRRSREQTPRHPEYQKVRKRSLSMIRQPVHLTVLLYRSNAAWSQMAHSQMITSMLTC